MTTLASPSPYAPSKTDTPMMRQYKAVKQDQQDAILFFRLGDFYEMFLEDAVTASKELSLTLTGRGKDENRIPMCGIPFHAAESYIHKLVTKGYKVAICEQTEDASESEGITKREVVRVITPGTVMSSVTLDESESNFLAAVSEASKKGEMALAYLDNSTGGFFLQAFPSIAELEQAIHQLHPKELLYPEELTLTLDNSILSSPYAPLPQDHAIDRLCKQFKMHSLDGFGLDGFEQAFVPAWALMDYLKSTQMTDLEQFTRLEAVRSEQYMGLDHVSAQNLELVHPIAENQEKSTLFWALNRTKTAMGARALKALLKRPYYDQGVIEERLDAVETLVTDILSREEIRELLSDVYDLERLTARIVSYGQNPKECLSLKDSLYRLKQLLPTLSQLSGVLLEEKAAFFQCFEDENSAISRVIALIERSIREDAPVTTRDGKMIKDGFDEELDALILSFKTIRDWIGGLEQSERERTGIKSLKVGYNKVFGYYFELSNAYKDQVPTEYIRKQTLTNAERYITPELKEKETILLTGEEKQRAIEKRLYEQVISELREYVPYIQDLASEIADLDLIQSLATVSHQHDYTRPQFLPPHMKVLDLKESRHPVLERQDGLHFIPNDIFLSSDSESIALITGPNMAGKSTVMRQVALIVVMAQIGCFVPASSAKLSLVDKLFTRIGALDKLYVGQSTFMVEMVETASILHNATENSLIILDEIGRGTSTYDGISIAASVLHYIHDSLRSRTLFATHYHELTQLSDRLSHLGLYSMAISEDKTEIVFQYRFQKGPADKSYGIHVAKMAGLPQSVIEEASELLTQLESQGGGLESQKAADQLSLF